MSGNKKSKTIIILVAVLVLAGAGVYAYINLDKLEVMVNKNTSGDSRDLLVLAQQAEQEGNPDMALDYYREFLDIHAEPPANADPGVGTAYGAMGNIYFKRFKYAQAIENMQKALDHANQHIGKQSRQAAGHWFALASVYDKQGEVELALDHYKHSRDIQVKLGGDTEQVEKLVDELETYMVNASLQSRSAS